MLTDLEQALNNLVEVFHDESLKQGNKHALYRNDLRNLMQRECPQYLKVKDADSWFQELDINSDNAINFEEFVILMMKVAVLAHKESHRE